MLKELKILLLFTMISCFGNYVSANYTTTKDLGDVLDGMRNIAYKICEMEVPESLFIKEK